MILPFRSSEPLDNALGAKGTLTTETIELVLSIRVLVTLAILLSFHAHVYSSVTAHYLSQVIFELRVLMGVKVAFFTEVGVVILTEFGSLIATRDTVFDL